jgi:3-phenylpropionate/trans-cinnamate dioxygenase ferredoxin component
MTDTMVKVADLSDIPEGSARVFSVGDKRLAVCRVSEGVFAIDDLCTHDGGDLGEGELVDSQIECPRHGARFDIKTGKAICLPAVMPVSTYPVEVRGQEIFVRVDN